MLLELLLLHVLNSDTIARKLNTFPTYRKQEKGKLVVMFQYRIIAIQNY